MNAFGAFSSPSAMSLAILQLAGGDAPRQFADDLGPALQLVRHDEALQPHRLTRIARRLASAIGSVAL
jgi:hypothetical protein